MRMKLTSIFVFAVALLEIAATRVAAAQPDDLHVLFISPQGKAGKENVAVFERRFSNRKNIQRATWSVTAQGVFEAYVNGCRAGNDFLKPGVTECGNAAMVDVNGSGDADVADALLIMRFAMGLI